MTNDALQNEADRLAEALGIPATPRVELEPGDGGAMTLLIDGAPCPVAPDPASPAESLTACRDLLVTPAVASELLEHWRTSMAIPEPTTPETFLSALRDLVRHCRRVDPPPPRTVEDAPAARPETLTESLLRTRNDESVTVFVEPYLLGGSDDADYDLEHMGAWLGDVLREDLGAVIPRVGLEADPSLAAGRFAITVNDLRLPDVEALLPDELLVNVFVDELRSRGFEPRVGVNPVTGAEAAVIRGSSEAIDRLRSEGFVPITPRAYIALTTRRLLARFAGSLLVPEAVRVQLRRQQADDPVVGAALGRFDMDLIVAVLRGLLAEEISIRDLPGILEGMLAIGGSVDVDHSVVDVVSADPGTVRFAADEERTPAVYVECVRRYLRVQTTRRLTNETGSVNALVADRGLESRLRDGGRALEPSEARNLLESVRSTFEPHRRSGVTVVLLANAEVRPTLRSLLERDIPSLRVLGHEEVEPGTKIEFIGQLALT